MRTRLVSLVLALCCVFLWNSATAAVKVTNIHLQKSNQFTEVTVVCSGTTDFTHQIVEAAVGKPYRIVVDVKDAVPDLPQLSFKNLPSGSIKQIRTSQFSVDPEKVVRIVLDVAGALTYKVKSDGNLFTLSINTPSDKDFPKWSAVVGPPAPILATSKPQPTGETVLASKPEAPKKPEAPAKTEVASKPEATKKSEAPAKIQTVAKAETPKSMPAHPDNPATPPKATGSEADTKDLKLATKPIDESQLLTKVTKSAPAAAVDEKAKPTSVGLTVADKTASGSDKTAKPSGKPELAPASNKEAPAAKRADSATLPQQKPTQNAPATEPVDFAKPPKSQKTALPETKVAKTPTYTQSPEAGNALTGKIATALEKKPATVASPKPESGQDSTAAGSMLSKSESVRLRYLAGKEKGTMPAEATEGSTATAEVAAPQTPPTAIEKIRTKYKRGIRFYQNDQDEQQQTASETEEPQEADQYSNDVGAYNEFLPEREVIVYQTSGRPDPFMPLIEEATSNAKGGELPDVETLRLVGILQGKKASRALFEDYNNYSYILSTGDRVKNGFVLSIEESRVVFQIRQYGWNRQVAIDLENEK